MSVADKEAITGLSLPSFGEDVLAATGSKGHPLFWSEIKEVEFFIALFKDCSVLRVFDVASGSSAAACAAAALGLSYEGVAMNAKHANWLNNIMDKTIFALLASQKPEEIAATVCAEAQRRGAKMAFPHHLCLTFSSAWM